MFNQANGAFKDYEPSIKNDYNNAVRIFQERIWYHKLDRQASIQTANHVGKKFVLSQVEETWVVWLKNETTLFEHVILRDILDHLRAANTGGETINVICLQQGMLSWWVKYLRVPEFITRCEEAKRKATRSGLAILDA